MTCLLSLRLPIFQTDDSLCSISKFPVTRMNILDRFYLY